MTRKVALVTGASSGIGDDTARSLRKAGFVVYGAARRVGHMTELAAAGIQTLTLDVTDEVSLKSAVADLLAAEGRIDVLVNCAGYGSYGALEDVPMEEARAQIEVNLFGLARLTQLVLPVMRAQRSGTIINISSMGGRFAFPMGTWYHASKFAVEGLSDALRLDVKRFGLNVVIIEPGQIRTDWGKIAAEKLRASSSQGAYAEAANAVATSLASASQPGASMTSSTGVIAKAVTRAATARRPRTRYRVGFGAAPLIFLHDVLPDRAFDALTKRMTGVPG